MFHDTRKKAQVLSLLLAVLKPILPRAVRERYMVQLQEFCVAAGDWPRQSIGAVLGAYKSQIILAFNAMVIATQVAGMTYIFSAAGVSFILAIVLGGVLTSLVLRGAITHPFDINGNYWKPTSSWQYSMDSMADAVVTVVVVLLCESLTLMIQPKPAMKPDPLFRCITLGIPVLATMRMVMRPRAPFHMPFQGSKLTADQIYKRAWWMNALWIATSQYIIVTNPNFLPEWVPARDFVSTVIPMKIYVTWFRVQQNPLIRRDHIETAFGMHWRKKEQARQREVLMKGLKKGEPLCHWYIGLQVLLFVYLSIPLARALWPWLAGGETNRDVYDVLFKAVILIALVWTWTYLKEANRAAADAVQQDIDSPDVVIPLKLRTRVANWFRRVFKGILTRQGEKAYGMECQIRLPKLRNSCRE